MSFRSILHRLAVTALAIIAVPWAVQAEDKPEVIRFGAISAADGRPVFSGVPGVLDTKGFLADEFQADGIEVRFVPIKGAGPGINEAFANGTIDFAMYGDFPAIVGRAGGLKTVWLAGNSTGSNSQLVVPNGSKAKSITDLKGKTIAIHKGRPWEIGLYYLLNDAGLKAKDFRIIHLTEGDIPTAIAAGAVDAAYTTAGQTIEKRAIGSIIWSTEDKNIHWKFTSELFGTEAFVRKYPAFTQRVVNQWVRASAYAGQNEAEFFKIGAKSSGDYDITVKNQYGRPVRETQVAIIDDFRIAHYKKSVEFLKQRGYLRRDVDVDSWVDRSFVDRAIREQGLEGFWTPRDAEGNFVTAGR
jgi:sulfonate transport system substrate-binding protein